MVSTRVSLLCILWFCSWHYGIMQSSVTTLTTLEALSVCPLSNSLPQTLGSHQSFYLFPECHRAGILQMQRFWTGFLHLAICISGSSVSFCGLIVFIFLLLSVLLLFFKAHSLRPQERHACGRNVQSRQCLMLPCQSCYGCWVDIVLPGQSWTEPLNGIFPLECSAKQATVCEKTPACSLELVFRGVSVLGCRFPEQPCNAPLRAESGSALIWWNVLNRILTDTLTLNWRVLTILLRIF